MSHERQAPTGGLLSIIYIAARYERRDEARRVGFDLAKMGHSVVSTWLDEPFDPHCALATYSAHVLRDMAERDMSELYQAELVLHLSDDPAKSFPRGGNHWEAGGGFTLGKKVVVVGPRQHIFHYLPQLQHFPAWETAKEFFRQLV